MRRLGGLDLARAHALWLARWACWAGEGALWYVTCDL